MATLTPIPDRSVEQRTAALIMANRVRSERAALKRDVHAGRVSVVDLLADPPACIETMKLFDLLVSQRRWGRAKADKLLARWRISNVKTVGGLSDRQRRAAIVTLETW